MHVFATLRTYRPVWLGGDLVAGIMLAAIAIPEQLATARLAGFPIEAGLWAFAAGTLAFAIVGANRYLSAGADSTVTSIFAATLGAVATAGSSAYVGLAAALAIGVGTILLIIGFARAGWVAGLLSIPVTTGFLAGIAAHIIIGQLPALLGIAPASGPLLVQLASVVARITSANAATCVLGLAVLALTIGCGRLSERIPGALIGLFGAVIAVATLDLRARGVAVLGELRLSLPSIGLPAVADARQLITIVPLAIVVAAVCALQTSLVVRSFPSQPDSEEDVGPDFIAIGAGNLVAGLTGTFPVNASPPRTAIAQGTGGRSQLTGLIALVVVGTLVALLARFRVGIPQTALAGILVFIGLRLLRWQDMVRIARRSRREIGLVIAAALLVIALPIQTGMLLAIMLSLAHGVSLVMFPPAAQLFAVPGTTIWWPATGDGPAKAITGVLVFAPAAPVNFTNAAFLRRRLLALIDAAPEPVTLVVIEASGMSDVDYTGAQVLRELIPQLRRRQIDVTLARLITLRAERAATRAGLIDLLGADHVFHSVAEAIARYGPAAVR
jgi:SulP family sulfate permease